MTFAFDYDMYDYLMDYLHYTGKDSKLFSWLMAQRKQAFKYLDYVNAYDPLKHKVELGLAVK